MIRIAFVEPAKAIVDPDYLDAVFERLDGSCTDNAVDAGSGTTAHYDDEFSVAHLRKSLAAGIV